MTTTNMLLLLFSILIAGSLSFLQYGYKAKNKSKANLFLAFLRFLSIFGVLLVLINPILTKNTFETVKTPLPIVVDNSSSISFLMGNEKVLELYKKIQSNASLQSKFDVQPYRFSNDFEPTETFNFKGVQTNIDVVAKNLKSIYKTSRYPTILITDGNQTSGTDYVYSFDAANKIYPVIIGDTTAFLDFKINQLNANKYAFHKNRFPVEVFLHYAGTKSIMADFVIKEGNSIVSKERIFFSASKNTANVNMLLPADKIGLHVFEATISSKEKEKNAYNNTRKFVVEVIDQKINVAIVSAINHPDLGALKRAIESNVKYKVTIVKPIDLQKLKSYNVLVLYQPTPDFKTIFTASRAAGINTFIITGNTTDFNFMNREQDNLNFRMSNQKEDYLSVFNTSFNLFAAENIGFENFPPLQNAFGSVTTKGITSVLLYSKIRNVETKSPLLVFTEGKGNCSAYLLGENSWKWRLRSHIDNQSFEKYDLFIDKIIQFLASNNSKKALVVEQESFYNHGEAIEITAQYFNKNYEFDEKARLTIEVTNTKTKQTKNYDLLKGANYYKVNLDRLNVGNYKIIIKELNSKMTYSGSFKILNYDIEKQFVNPDILKLTQLALRTKGKVYFPNEIEVLIQTLIQKEEYKAVQQRVLTKTPLIDWIWLLVLIASSLAMEWIVRKYNGLL